MKRCPNPECAFLARTGMAGEYRDGFDVCSDCGAELVEGAVEAPARPSGAPWPGHVVKRMALVAVVLLLVWLARYLPHPMISWEGNKRLWDLGSPTGPLSLGTSPLLVAFVLVEVVALIVPRLRARRRTDGVLRRQMWTVSLLVALALACVQAWGFAFGLENLAWNVSPWGGYSDPAVLAPGWLFRLETMAMMVIGTGLLGLVALMLERNGLGRGFALLLLLEAVTEIGWAGESLVHSLRVGALTPLGGIVLLAAVAGALAALRWFFRPGRSLPLPVSGLWPLEVGLLIAMGPSLLDTFGVPGLTDLSMDLVPGGQLYLEMVMAGVLLWLIPAATLFHWRRRKELWGPQRKQWLRALGGSAAFLIALVLLDHLIWGQGGGLAWPGALGLLSLYVLGADWWEEVVAWRRSPAEAPLRLIEQHQDPVDALEALAARRAADPDGYYVLTGLRFRSLTWFFAPFVSLLVLGVPGPQED